MSTYVGQTLSFLYRGRMVPVKVERHVDVPSCDGLPAENYLVIKSLDLTMEARIPTFMWDEQKKRLEEAEQQEQT